MERYCIEYDGKNMGRREDYTEANQSIRFDRFILIQVGAYHGERIFPECEGSIKGLFEMSVNSEDEGTETEMYQDIFSSIPDQDMVRMDVYLHIYYTLLYGKNRNDFIPLIPQEWTKEKREDIKKKRKECRRNMKGKVFPFKILEGDNIFESDNGKKFYGETKISDFAPNMGRLYYLSKEFRNLFTDIKKNDAKKYKYSEIERIFQNEVMQVPRKEEIWLCERLLGVNLAWAFHSFFSVVFKGKTFVEIEECRGIVQKIIHAIMCWQGVYSRILFVDKLKIIYELRVRSAAINKDIETKEELEYLYKGVICNYMDIADLKYGYIEHRMYSVAGNMLDKEDFLAEVGSECDGYIKKYFCDAKGYAFLKGINPLFSEKMESGEKTEDKNNTDMGVQEDERQEPDERLYAFIQKIIINEQRK